MIDIKEVQLKWLLIFLNKKTAGGVIKNEIIQNKQIIRKFEKRKAHSSFINNIWGTDLADMQLLSKLNKGISFLLCDNDIISNYAWVITL